MHLYIKQKVLTIRDRFKVYGDDEQEKYDVTGKIISIGRKFTITQNEQLIARVEQEVLHIFAHFNVYIEGQENFRLVRKFSFLKPKYEIEGLNWYIQGDFWQHDYQIVDANQQPIATISKHWITIGDTYDININNDKDELAVLCIVIAIDADKANQESSSNVSLTD